MDQKQINAILKAHAAWLADEPDGKRANLTRAILTGAILTRADLRGADLWGAILTRADLTGADLAGADLRYAKLVDANLADANLADAILTDANLADANLTGAIMPDGRTWEQYRADHYAGICDDPEVRQRANAAWGSHVWSDCPMHAALGIGNFDDIKDDKRRNMVACWIALYDSGQLPAPN